MSAQVAQRCYDSRGAPGPRNSARVRHDRHPRRRPHLLAASDFRSVLNCAGRGRLRALNLSRGRGQLLNRGCNSRDAGPVAARDCVGTRCRSGTLVCDEPATIRPRAGGAAIERQKIDTPSHLFFAYRVVCRRDAAADHATGGVGFVGHSALAFNHRPNGDKLRSWRTGRRWQMPTRKRASASGVFRRVWPCIDAHRDRWRPALLGEAGGRVPPFWHARCSSATYGYVEVCGASILAQSPLLSASADSTAALGPRNLRATAVKILPMLDRPRGRR